jgi:chromosome partitioning protein
MLSPMQIVSVLSEKGGAGKTTVAVHLAVAGCLDGLDTVIIDLDPQASAADWCDRRGDKPEAVAIPPARLGKLLGDLRTAKVELVIVDTGRDSNNAGYIAAQAADLIIIPCRPGGFDFHALGRTVDLCKLARKDAHILVNAMRPGAKRIDADTREALASKGYGLVPVSLHERVIYRHASISRQTAQETDPDSEASSEIQQLYNWVRQQSKLSTT